MLYKYMQLKYIVEKIHITVESIRENLREKYYVYDEKSLYKNYAGLCNIASELFCKSMTEYFDNHKKLLKISYSVGSIHGEQKHSPKILSKYWGIQHTWCYVKLDNNIIYVDITSEQFKSLYPDIPDYYISTMKPKWFYPDRNNPAFRGIFGFINKHVLINHKILDLHENPRKVRDGIIEFFQYTVWGHISDKIGKKIFNK